MSTQITRNQVILLVVLGVVLVIIIYVQLLIRPALSEASEAKSQYDSLEEEYDNLVQQSAMYEQNLANVKTWRDNNAVETNQLYPLAASWQLDRFLNFVLQECGIVTTGLTISDIQGYYVDSEGALVMTDPEIVEEALAAQSEESSAALSYNEASSQAEQAAEAAYTETGEFRQDFTYEMVGNYEDMVQLLNFIDGLSFLGITDFTFDSVSDTATDENPYPELTDSYTFTVTISAYMFDDPLADDTADEESSAAEESSVVEESSAEESA